MIDLLAQNAVTNITLGWWKAILILLPFVGWAWLVATKLDKDARYFHLNVPMWNGLQIGGAVVALAVMLLIPGTVHIFWISYPLGLLILAAPTLAYWKHRNERVPASKRYYLTSKVLTDALSSRQEKRASKAALIRFTDSKKQLRSAPQKDSPLQAVHTLTEEIIGPAVDSRASRLEIAAKSGGTVIVQTIDGVRTKRDPIPVEQGVQVIDYLKDIAGLDVEDRRRQQAGKFKLSIEGESKDVSLVTAGSSSGQMVRMDFDRRSQLQKPYDGLGLLPSQMETLETLYDPSDRHGIVLLGAPSGHGLTTTGYSMLSKHDAYTSNIKTLEKEVLLELDGVDHTEFDASTAETDFATNLQSILRRDPDVVMLSNLEDAQTARIASEPGMDGPLMYIPIRANTIEEQIQHWVSQVGDIKQAIKPLRAVINQRLLRSLCPNCRQPFTPSAEQIKKLNLPAERAQQLFRATGQIQVKNKVEVCPVCKGTGYLGQLAVYEVFFLDSEARKLLINKDLKGARAHARRNKMIYLQEAALSKVLNGETTLEEIMRVLSPGGGKKKPAASGTPTPAPS
ncbi:MAG: hypothetical protein EA377_12240 [Phycisphaerales bacterium]|nr:MAG: hypothetical protein EA377_12240 [Phycisphaerales bacterium]